MDPYPPEIVQRVIGGMDDGEGDGDTHGEGNKALAAIAPPLVRSRLSGPTIPTGNVGSSPSANTIDFKRAIIETSIYGWSPHLHIPHHGAEQRTDDGLDERPTALEIADCVPQIPTGELSPQLNVATPGLSCCHEISTSSLGAKLGSSPSGPSTDFQQNSEPSSRSLDSLDINRIYLPKSSFAMLSSSFALGEGINFDDFDLRQQHISGILDEGTVNSIAEQVVTIANRKVLKRTVNDEIDKLPGTGGTGDNLTDFSSFKFNISNNFITRADEIGHHNANANIKSETQGAPSGGSTQGFELFVTKARIPRQTAPFVVNNRRKFGRHSSEKYFFELMELAQQRKNRDSAAMLLQKGTQVRFVSQGNTSGMKSFLMVITNNDKDRGQILTLPLPITDIRNVPEF